MAWEELNPEFREHLRQDQTTARAVSLIILFIVLLGVLASLMAEREQLFDQWRRKH